MQVRTGSSKRIGIKGASALVALVVGAALVAPGAGASAAVRATPVDPGVNCLVNTNAGGTVSGFAKFDGIKGDSTTIGHENEVVLTSLDFCVTGTVSIGSAGTGAGSTKPILHDLVLGKNVDSATAPLLRSLEAGNTIKNAVITLTRPSKGAPVTFLTLTLSSVIVTSSAVALTGGQVGETVKLTAGKASLTIDKTGAPPSTACFDFTMNRLC